MEAKLTTLMDRCLPLKTVTMSSRDPAWMSPVVKTLLKKKSRRSCNNKEQLATINRRISELICENRTHLAAPVGSGGWSKTVDDITQRGTHSNSVVLEKHLCQPVEWLFSWTLDGPELHCTSRCGCRERNRRTWDSWEACLEKSWQDQTNNYGSW